MPPVSVPVPLSVPVQPSELYAPGGFAGNAIVLVSTLGTVTVNVVCAVVLQFPAASRVST